MNKEQEMEGRVWSWALRGWIYMLGRHKERGRMGGSHVGAHREEGEGNVELGRQGKLEWDAVCGKEGT